MRSAVAKSIPETGTRSITHAEVMNWFARGHKPWPTEKDCADIAARLTKMRWPGEELPAIGDDEQWQIDYPGSDGPPVYQRVPYKADPWWDLEKAAASAKVLLDNIPAMLWHWQRLQTTPYETIPGQKPANLRGGYEAIERLRVALDAALPYIEFPFGEYERQDHRKRKRPKAWHAHAIAITPIIADALRQSGHPVRGTTHNTALVRIVRQALVRIGHDKNIKPAAVAAKMTAWYAEMTGTNFTRHLMSGRKILSAKFDRSF